MSMRKLATLAEIDKVRIHPNADNLDLVTIRGWQVVTKRGEFEPGDQCVYVEIDSVLPDRPEFEFMRNRKFRVRTIKLRGELSQGIVFPTEIIPFEFGNCEVGDDLTEAFGIALYSPPIPACLAGDVEGKFPSFIPKTDCERIQNHPWIIEQFQDEKCQDVRWLATEKLDGSSTTIWYDNGLHVCSRNWELSESERNAYWIAARRMNLEDKLKGEFCTYVLQGELLGPKIQGNRYGIGFYQIFFFDIWNTLQNRYLNVNEFFDLCHELNLPTVPRFAEYFGLPRVDRLLAIAECKSALKHDVEQEGLVFKPLTEIHDPRIGRVAFKAISNKFLLNGH